MTAKLASKQARDMTSSVVLCERNLHTRKTQKECEHMTELKVKYSADLTSLSLEEKKTLLMSLSAQQISKNAKLRKIHSFCSNDYFVRLAYEHNESSQADALVNQKSRAELNKIYLRYVQILAYDKNKQDSEEQYKQALRQAYKFITERKELLLSDMRALYTLNITESVKRRKLIFDLLSTDATEIKQLLTVVQ